MGRLILTLILFLSLSVKAQEALDKVRDFFGREGYAVKVEGQRVLVDLGKDKVRPGEEFDVVREGKEIVHPITKQVIGKEKEKVGRIRVEEVQEGFSHARLLEGSAKEGDRVKLKVESACFDGGDELFFKLKAQLPDLKRGKACIYDIKELSDGIGVEYKGSPVDFFRVQSPALGIERARLEDINLLAKSKMLRALPS